MVSSKKAGTTYRDPVSTKQNKTPKNKDTEKRWRSLDFFFFVTNAKRIFSLVLQTAHSASTWEAITILPTRSQVTVWKVIDRVWWVLPWPGSWLAGGLCSLRKAKQCYLGYMLYIVTFPFRGHRSSWKPELGWCRGVKNGGKMMR